jgi:hypothetical protein
MRNGRYATVILLLAVIHLFGVVGPLFFVHTVPVAPRDTIGIQEIGGLSGMMTVVRGNISDSIRRVMEAGRLMNKTGTQQLPVDSREKRNPWDRLLVSFAGTRTIEPFKLSPTGGLDRLFPVSVALLSGPAAVGVTFAFLSLLCVHRCTLSRWRTALARGNIDDTASSITILVIMSPYWRPANKGFSFSWE